MLADRIGLGGLHLSGRYWPLIVVALGILRMGAPSRHGRSSSTRTGAWLVYIGLWGLVSEFHMFGFDFRTSWPLLVVGAGVFIVWRAVESPAGGRGPVQEN